MSDRPETVSKYRQAITVSKLLFTPLAIGFLVFFAWRSRDILADVVTNASPSYLVLAVGIWALLHFLSPALAVLVLNSCGSRITWRQAFATHAARLPARYLPGGVWHTVGRVLDYRDRNVNGQHLFAFVLVEHGQAVALTIAAGGSVIFALRGPGQFGTVAAISSLAGIAAIVVLYFLLNARVLRAPDRLHGGAYLGCIGLVSLFWAGATTAFLFFFNAFPSLAVSYSNIEIAAAYLFSWGVGFLAVFAPQGIGVFELVAGQLLRGDFGFMGLAALLAGFRVVVLAADMLVWIFYLASRRTFGFV